MSKLYYQAMKVIPDDFVDDETRVATMTTAEGKDKAVVMVNPKHSAMIYTPEVPEWKAVEFSEAAQDLVWPEGYLVSGAV